MASENKRIAKNTGFLYLRMLFVMGVTLYTSRVVLQALGVEDYGLYNVIGGIVVMLGFLNGCASSATSRFLTYALGSKEGSKDHYDYRTVFSAAFFIHLTIALLIVLLAETIGIWYFNNKLVIPDGRYGAAMWVYQISIINVLVSFTQVPYNASIIAHERINIYAFVGIYEAVTKLLIAYALTVANVDKLILYALLIFSVTLSISLYYRFYCVRKFGNTCKIQKVRDKSLYKRLLSYSGWDLLGAFGSTARSEGVNLILNLFCGPAVNAARGIAYQVEAALYHFINNFHQAVRPVIIKHHAAGELERSNKLLYLTGKFSILLFSCFAIPLILESDYFLSLWLVNPPKYTSIFLQIVLLMGLVTTINNTLQIGAHACGDVKHLNIYGGSRVFVEMPIIYFVLRAGASPEWALIILLIGTALINAANLYVVNKNIPSFSPFTFLKESVVYGILLMLIPAFCAYFVHHQGFTYGIVRVICVSLVYVILLILFVYQFSLTGDQRHKVLSFVKNKISR